MFIPQGKIKNGYYTNPEFNKQTKYTTEDQCSKVKFTSEDEPYCTGL